MILFLNGGGSDEQVKDAYLFLKEKAEATANFTHLSFDAPVIALPEEDTLVIDKNTVTVVGAKSYRIFKKGSAQQMEPNQTYFISTFRNLIKD